VRFLLFRESRRGLLSPLGRREKRGSFGERKVFFPLALSSLFVIAFCFKKKRKKDIVTSRAPAFSLLLVEFLSPWPRCEDHARFLRASR
jgi:hypothetical protein